MAPRAPARSLPNDPQRHHADFIQRFTQQESERRIAKRPKALTAAQHAALREQLKEVHFLKPDYADNIKINIAGMLRKWKGIKSWGISWEYFRQYKQLYASVTGRYMHRNDSREVLKWHDATLVPLFDLQAPNSGGKDVADAGALLALQTFNIAFDTSIFFWESPKDGCWEELFGREAIEGSFGGKGEGGALDDVSRVLEEILSQETVGRGRSKCLCYEDILLMVVRYPETGEDVLAMLIKFIHHKGADNKPKPTVFFFTLTRRLIFCLITVIVSLALHDGAFAAPSLTSIRRVFEAKNRGPVKCTPLRWEREWLKRPEIEGQANREEEQEYVEPAVDLHIPERAELAEILCNQPEGLSSAAFLALRIQAGELMFILCNKRETVKRDRIRQRAPADVMVKEESPGPDKFPLLMQRTQCPRCIGDEGLSYKERTFQYCRPTVMYDHFDRTHAKHMSVVKQMVCNHPKCKGEALRFEHLDHFKNHVERIYGVKLRA
ncbi:hypothetical protein DL768_005584 [Monosporascus sp. mg162]|nr:hypothetical protein DL768_005584 [Monosporascus sp. mg162]